jgi:lysozyme
MKTSAAGIAIIKRWEGLRLRAYLCTGKRWTIGWGTTVYPNGRRVRPGDTCTTQQAEEYLANYVAALEKRVFGMIRVPVTQNQFDALVSFAYNVGEGEKGFLGSTLLRLLNAGDYAGAAGQFRRWNIANGKEDKGLINRRASERDLFLSPAKPKAVKLISEPQVIEDKPMLPVLTALLPTIIGMIPSLTKVFTDGTSVTDRNLVVAQKVGELIVDATNSTNLQQAVETMQTNPEALQAANAAVSASWFELVESGGGGIAGAREYSLKAASGGADFWKMPAFWVTVMLMPLLYGTVYLVLTGDATSFSSEVRAAIASAVVTGVLGGCIGFWLGSSYTTSRSRGLGSEPTQKPQ